VLLLTIAQANLQIECAEMLFWSDQFVEYIDNNFARPELLSCESRLISGRFDAGRGAA
jgi:hypothetical protein